MYRVIGRHGLAECNRQPNGECGPAFNHRNAPLIPEGCVQAQKMGLTSRTEFGIDPAVTRVAVSTMWRSIESALKAGFDPDNIRIYPCLDEPDAGLPYQVLREEYLNQRRFPPNSLEAADAVLENPPPEEFWMIHGVLASAICARRDDSGRFKNFVPECGELRQVYIPQPATATAYLSAMTLSESGLYQPA